MTLSVYAHKARQTEVDVVKQAVHAAKITDSN